MRPTHTTHRTAFITKPQRQNLSFTQQRIRGIVYININKIHYFEVFSFINVDIISYQQVGYAMVNVQKLRVSIDGRNGNMYIKTIYV